MKQQISRIANRLLTSIPTLVIACALAGADTPTAFAAPRQSAVLTSPPLSTAGLGTYLSSFVTPTPEEAIAVDRLHETYLERFRKEIDPEIKSLEQVAGTVTSAWAGEGSMARLIQGAERLQARIAEIENAFFDGVAATVADERQEGVLRARLARERERLLTGPTSLTQTLFSSGGRFVDITALLAEKSIRDAVAEDAAERFDLLLRNQEARTLTQARELRAAFANSAEQLIAMLDAEREFAAARADARVSIDETREQFTRQAALRRSHGEAVRRVIEANHRANRAACVELASILPERIALELRATLADTAITDVKQMLYSGVVTGDADGTPARVAARIRGDRDVTPAQHAEIDAIVLSWLKAHTKALEDLAELSLATDPFELYSFEPANLRNDAEPTRTATQQRVYEAATRVTRCADDALRSMISVLGPRSQAHLVEIEIDGRTMIATIRRPLQQSTTQANIAPSLIADVTSDGAEAFTMREIDRLRTALQPRRLGDIRWTLERVGVSPKDLAPLAPVYERWLGAEFLPKVVMPMKGFRDYGRGALPAGAPDGGAAEDAAITQGAQRLIAAAFAADDALYTDIAAALGLAQDGPEISALRLGRATLLGEVQRADARVTLPLPILVQSGASPELTRAVLADPEWRTVANALPGYVIEYRAAIDDVRAFKRALAAGEVGNDVNERFLATMRRKGQVLAKAQAVFSQTFDRAITRIVTDADQRANLFRAQRTHCFPDLHRTTECISEPLATAIALDGLDEDRVARLEALKAEYDMAFDALTLRLIELSDVSHVPDAPADGFEDALRRIEGNRAEFERVRFQRNERTERARAEAFRILGDALAAKVRGLAIEQPDEEFERRFETKPEREPKMEPEIEPKASTDKPKASSAIHTPGEAAWTSTTVATTTRNEVP